MPTIEATLIDQELAVLGKIATDSGIPERAPITRDEALYLRDHTQWIYSPESAGLLAKVNALIEGR